MKILIVAPLESTSLMELAHGVDFKAMHMGAYATVLSKIDCIDFITAYHRIAEVVEPNDYDVVCGSVSKDNEFDLVIAWKPSIIEGISKAFDKILNVIPGSSQEQRLIEQGLPVPEYKEDVLYHGLYKLQDCTERYDTIAEINERIAQCLINNN